MTQFYVRLLLCIATLLACVPGTAETSDPHCGDLADPRRASTPVDETVVADCAKNGHTDVLARALWLANLKRDRDLTEQLVRQIEVDRWRWDFDAPLIGGGHHDILEGVLKRQGLAAADATLERRAQWLAAATLSLSDSLETLQWLLRQADLPDHVLTSSLLLMASTNPKQFTATLTQRPWLLDHAEVALPMLVKSIEYGSHDAIDWFVRYGWDLNADINGEYPMILHSLIDGKGTGMKNRETWDFLVARGAIPQVTVCKTQSNVLDEWRQALPEWATSVIDETLATCP
ncbi:MAG: hypothetical protein AAGL69_00455 [Pseudomonadota bacterium]